MKKSRLILIGLMTASIAACATPSLNADLDDRAPRFDVQRNVPSIAFPTASGPSYEKFLAEKDRRTTDAFGRIEERPGEYDTGDSK